MKSFFNKSKEKLEHGLEKLKQKGEEFLHHVDDDDIPPIIEYKGPYLRYVSASNGNWRGSVLIVTENDTPPVITLSCLNPDENFSAFNLRAMELPNKTAMASKFFWRFNINIPQSPEQTLKYQYVVNGDNSKKFNFHVASSSDKYWRWAFYSCNGLSSDVDEAKKEEIGGIQPLWIDLLRSHYSRPYHAMVGGGDQVYADQMWYDCPNLVEWLGIKGKENRMKFEWNQSLEEELNQFYFELYVNAWSEPYIAEALATIPSINTLDDHDVWDGYGTYPDWLSKSAIFQNAGRIALDFYAIFQLHTTREMSRQDGYFGAGDTYNYIRMFGPRTAVCMIDTRSERTMDQVVSAYSWGCVRRALDSLPDSVRHVIFVTGVPIIHPRLEAADKLNAGFGEIKEAANNAANAVSSTLPFLKDVIKDVKHSLGKTGLFSSLINHFGLPELSDDLGDHWTFENHVAERTRMILLLQDVAREKNVRFTLLGGDVHCCAAGRFFNSKNPEGRDYRLMYQITSSAIGNIPPPGAVIKMINESGKRVHDLDEKTKEEQLKVFQKDVDGTDADGYSLARRNYAICYPGSEKDSLEFCFRLEPVESGTDSIGYALIVPSVE